MPVKSVALLRNGLFKLDGGCMFGLLPKVVWSKWVDVDADNKFAMQQGSLLVELEDGKLALLEVGLGDKLSDKDREIFAAQPRTVVDSLSERGVAPEDIDYVFITHLHFDHAGALTTGADARPTFPTAKVVLKQQEWDDAKANKSHMHATYLPSHLTDEIAERLHAVKGEESPIPGITCLPSPGHTWGQQDVLIDTAEGPRLFASDCIPTRHHSQPTTNLAFDVEPYTAMLHRPKLIERAVREHWLIMPNHEPDAMPVFRFADHPKKPGRHVLEQASFNFA